MNRRAFLTLPAFAAASPLARSLPQSRPSAPGANASGSKRDRMLAWLAGNTTPGYTPAAFFLHFGPNEKAGSAATKRHLEFFRHTGMDFVKIQFEQTYQRQPYLKQPADWSKIPPARIDFYEPLLITVRELVKAAKKDALILMTLYSPFMGARQCAGEELLKRHLQENPDAVKRGLETLTANQMLFVKACIDAGVDGFYMSTQGSESGRLPNPETFTKYVKPFDLVAMKEAQSRLPFNILHVCDYEAPYASLDAVRDYPGHVVNCNPKLTGKTLTMQQLSDFFGRPPMGGLDRHGILAKGDERELVAEVRKVIQNAPRQFILGADCTVASDTDWNRLRRAISTAHGARA